MMAFDRVLIIRFEDGCNLVNLPRTGNYSISQRHRTQMVKRFGQYIRARF